MLMGWHLLCSSAPPLVTSHRHRYSAGKSRASTNQQQFLRIFAKSFASGARCAVLLLRALLKAEAAHGGAGQEPGGIFFASSRRIGDGALCCRCQSESAMHACVRAYVMTRQQQAGKRTAAQHRALATDIWQQWVTPSRDSSAGRAVHVIQTARPSPRFTNHQSA
jgi:hypothetical protein